MARLMQDAIRLSYLFEREHPGVQLNFVSLPENEARAKITRMCPPRSVSSKW
jgi:ABC-type glycerol-3-phosphate transport system substrate-binding protein